MPKKSVLIFVVAAAVIVGLVCWMLTGDETPGETLVVSDANIQSKNTDTIADKWQWNNFANTKPASNAGENSEVGKPRPKGALPYDAVEVYKVLQSIKLDENGRLVLDHTVLQVLENGYSNMGPDLSPEAMSGLQDLIRKGLPGHAGEEAAHILESYYRYRSAEVDFNEQLANQLPASDHYKQLMQMRRNYLGQEIADKLFAVEDTQARHMLAAIAIQQDANLTAEEKQAKQKVLQAQLSDRQLATGQLKPEEAAAEKVGQLREQGASSADIYSTRKAILGAEGARELAAADREDAQWQSRFNGFWQARRYVMQAGLDAAERDRQIEQLLNQYFSSEEQERARATSVEWQARDST